MYIYICIYKNMSCNIILNMFICIQMDVEYNENTPSISFSLVYTDYGMSAENEIIIPENIKHMYISRACNSDMRKYIKHDDAWGFCVIDTGAVQQATVSDNHGACFSINVDRRWQFANGLLISHSVRQNQMAAGDH